MARSRSGRFSSPATKLEVCHPPYANMTGVIAARNPSVPAPAAGCENLDSRTRNAPATMSITMAPSLSSMSTVCVLLPLRTPRMLMNVSSQITAMATMLVTTGR